MNIRSIIEKFDKRFVQFENGVIVGGFEQAPYTRIKSFIRSEITDLLEELRKENEIAIDLLRSANEIANREGKDTNWDGFRKQINKFFAKQKKLNQSITKAQL